MNLRQESADVMFLNKLHLDFRFVMYTNTKLYTNIKLMNN
jgi:hypothetical protein